MTFIDDYTRMCWVYLLKEKAQAFNTFKNFHLWIKNETQLNIGTLRSDNGGEYTSKDFDKYLQEMVLSIKQVFIITHSRMV